MELKKDNFHFCDLERQFTICFIQASYSLTLEIDFFKLM